MNNFYQLILLKKLTFNVRISLTNFFLDTIDCQQLYSLFNNIVFSSQKIQQKMDHYHSLLL